MLADEYDFGGYATRYNVKCTDGRTILPGAFSHCDGLVVPVVWQHDHNSPDNVLGKCRLEDRDDGIYCYAEFNDNEMGQRCRKMIQHGDLTRLSIFANHVKESQHNVFGGDIREVSIVYAGANEGAFIDTVSMAHGDDMMSNDVIIYSGDDIELFHADSEGEKMTDKKKTVKDVIDSMTEEQKNVLYFLIDEALKEESGEDDVKHEDLDENEVEFMNYNAFERNGENTISHADEFFAESDVIFADAKRCGSLKDSVIAHAAEYGIDNIDILFPDAKMVGEPSTKDRDQDWVSTFLNGASKSPFYRIKSVYFDITADEARAKGYVKGNKKVDEVIEVLKRTTDPTTIYKKQRFDRDDLEDVDFDVIRYIKTEMRGKLDEELARAALVGDGRSASSPDRIDKAKIRPIYGDDEIYAPKAIVGVAASDSVTEKASKLIDAAIAQRKKYKGSGNPTYYTTEDILSSMLLLKDTNGHYIYKSVSELATTLRVSNIVTVPVMEGHTRTEGGKTYELAAIMVKPSDYTFGTKGGSQVAMFDDFDMDYNQQKFLIETRTSGALTKPDSALVFEFEMTGAAG